MTDDTRRRTQESIRRSELKKTLSKIREDRHQIRRRYEGGEKIVNIAKEYRCDTSHITKAVETSLQEQIDKFRKMSPEEKERHNFLEMHKIRHQIWNIRNNQLND